MKRVILVGLVMCFGFWAPISSASESINFAKEIRGKTIDINSADVDSIMANTSFDAATANEIVDYRNKYGHFKTVSELLKVPNVQYRQLRENNNISLK